eukprot:XP_011681459.1 PREDICTED: uncharacterized protein LOC105446395 [Strongylocentrotus purpuratus]
MQGIQGKGAQHHQARTEHCLNSKPVVFHYSFDFAQQIHYPERSTFLRIKYLRRFGIRSSIFSMPRRSGSHTMQHARHPRQSQRRFCAANPFPRESQRQGPQVKSLSGERTRRTSTAQKKFAAERDKQSIGFASRFILPSEEGEPLQEERAISLNFLFKAPLEDKYLSETCQNHLKPGNCDLVVPKVNPLIGETCTSP